MPTKTSKSGSTLFIVDNSDADWKVAQYLHDWCQLSKAIDIATGYFEIGALLKLDGQWQGVDKIRILMGNDVSARTAQAIRRACQENWTRVRRQLDDSIEAEKESNAFLTGVDAIVEALRTGKIECRAFTADRFHAKAYITHARLDVVGSSALVGSSNFTVPGITNNIELNVQINGTPVGVLQEWFETHWNAAEPVTPDVLRIVERHVAEYSPFEVYAKALHELFRDSAYTGLEWEVVGPDKGGSRVFPKLDRYQQEGYRNALRIADEHRGAFICDGVGLGKTFIGLMLLERLVMQDRQRVALVVPKSGRKAVWENTIRRYCPQLLSGFVPLRIVNHTDLNRLASGDVNWPDVMNQIREQADAVVIDEAHNFRNPGLAGEGEQRPSRYRKLYDMLEGPAGPKKLFMLTATPINNSLHDFRHMTELFTRRDEGFFARTLGINHVRSYFVLMEQQVRASVAAAVEGHGEPTPEATREEEERRLESDRLFRTLVVQRSRAYVKASQLQDGRTAAIFPDRELPEVAKYSLKKSYGQLLKMVDEAFNKVTPLFVLPIYYPLAYPRGPKLSDALLDSTQKQAAAFVEGRQKQVVALIRTMFLKRFESSAHAFGRSCERLMLKLLAWAEVHAETQSEKRRLDRWKASHPDLTGFIEQMHIRFEDEEEEADEDLVPQEMLDAVKRVDRKDFRVEDMLDDVIDDLNQIADFTKELSKLGPKQDDKLQALLALLRKDPVLKRHKCLIFTEFADTARYLKSELQKAGIEGVEAIDGSSSLDRGEVITRFSPYYNESSVADLAKKDLSEIRILISTDVLSEGLNLQDATRLINYDIHWNPVRLMQRIGRVDRRMNPDVETALIADHPDQKDLRGHVKYWNFLPPDELNLLLSLYTRVTHKVLRISETFGIEGGTLLHPDDHLKALKEFNEAYEGTPSLLEELRLTYRGLLAADASLEARLNGLPGRVFSGKASGDSHFTGVFFCYSLPVLRSSTAGTGAEEWSTDEGTTTWYLLDLNTDRVIEEVASIHSAIACNPATLRRAVIDRDELLRARARIERHIKNDYLKRVQAPMGVKPVLRAWMELNQG